MDGRAQDLSGRVQQRQTNTRHLVAREIGFVQNPANAVDRSVPPVRWLLLAPQGLWCGERQVGGGCADHGAIFVDQECLCACGGYVNSQ